jgi:hypothetical protein
MGMFSDIDYSLIVLQLEKAMANGVATLDSNTKVPKAQISLTASDVGAIASTGNEVLTSLNAASGTISSGLLPSYVDDVLSYTNLAGFPGTGETGKIYVDETTNKVYRWSGSVYVEISSSATAGEALKLTTPRTITTTGDASYSVSFDGSANVTSAITLATVNSNAGSFGSASSIPAITVNAKGQVTAVSTNSIGNELIAIQSLSDTPGFLKKTGDGTYSIDVGNYLPLSAGGNVGIGTASPDTKLHILHTSTEDLSTNPNWPSGTLKLEDNSAFDSGRGPSITFYKKRDSAGNQSVAASITATGVQYSEKLQFYVGSASTLGSSPKMTIQVDGNIGIGLLNPSTKLQVAGTITTTDMIVSAATPSTSPTTGASRVTGGQGVQGNQYVGGFSSLGGDANHPAIKIKVLTGTTASIQGATVTIAHGVDSNKILSVSVLVEWQGQCYLPNSHNIAPGYYFDFFSDTQSVYIVNNANSSYHILSRPVKITLIYTA